MFSQVYNPQKPQRFGIKIFILCEASTGYMLAFEVYEGARADERMGEKTYNLVFRLLSSTGLLHKGYTLYTDR